MQYAYAEEQRPILELVDSFVTKELLPLEKRVLEREAAGEGRLLPRAEMDALDARAKEYGLWGLDVPAELNGADLPTTTMMGVNEALGRTIVFYTFPPDSPNLRMLQWEGTPDQHKRYLLPSLSGEKRSNIAVTEPGGGGDPAGMTTRAQRVGADWVINGHKLWISGAGENEFIVLMAATGESRAERGRISAFLIDKGTPGFNISRRIPMVGGMFTYEIIIENCRLSSRQLLGKEGEGFIPLQKRFSYRRLQLAAWCIGMAQRALDMMIEYAPQRKTFGVPLSERQAIQWWVADAATQIHASRLILNDAAWKIDRNISVRKEASMVKFHAAEVAQTVIDQAMQTFGAMGLSKEMPLHLMASTVRWIRMGEGPSEVHRALVARELFQGR